MKNKQTAVEWLYERLERMIPKTALYDIDKKQYYEKAKAMEKQQHSDTWEDGMMSDNGFFGAFEQYYNQTFKQPEQ